MVHVSLSEVLEVRGGPLQEHEIWAVLCQATEAVQDLFLQDKAHDGMRALVAITPDSCLLGANGRVTFRLSKRDAGLHSNRYLPPEFGQGLHISDIAVEKIYIFSLGAILCSATDYPNTAHRSPLSEDLESILGAMCQTHPAQRLTIVHILEACSMRRHSYSQHQSFSQTVSNLYKSVLGSQQSINRWYEDDESLLEYSQNKSRLPSFLSPNKGRQRERSKSKSRSRSGSRSRSRSQDRHRYNYRDRPLPVGRDQPVDVPHDGYTNKTPLLSRRNSRRRGKARLSGRNYRRPIKSNFPTHSSHSELYRMQPGSSNSLKPQYLNRKALSQIQLGQASRSRPHHLSALSLGTYRSHAHHKLYRKASFSDPHYRRAIHETYERLRERRRKLSSLRSGLDLENAEDMDFLSPASSDYGDERSMVSSVSFTQGVYQPDLLQDYGRDVALQFGRDTSPLTVENVSILSEDMGWLRHPEVNIPDRVPSLPSYHVPRPTGDGGRESRIMGAEGVSSPPGTLERRKKPAAMATENTTTKQKSKSSPKPRKIYGPEFVAQANNPTIRISVPGMKMTSPKELRSVTVVLLSGQKMEVSCETTTLGKQLFDAVVSHVNIPEYYFFGLTFIREGEHYFLDTDIKLQKVAPPQWKDPGKNRSQLYAFTLFFRVKYYVEDLRILKHPLSRHLLYLQLRRDILEERAHCTSDECMNLAGLALQAEYGDYNKTTCASNYFLPEHYVPPRIVRRLGSAYTKDNLPEAHKSHVGVKDLRAEHEFVKAVQNLPEYGIHFYKVYKKKNTSVPVWTGISLQGVVLCDQQADSRLVIQKHKWQNTEKISFNRRRFSILPKSEAGPIKLAKLNYYTASAKKGRYLLQFCTAQHHFQMKMKTHANISDIFEYDSSLPVAGGAKRYQPVDMDMFGGMADSRGSYGDDDYMTNSDEEGTITEETTPLKRVYDAMDGAEASDREATPTPDKPTRYASCPDGLSRPEVSENNVSKSHHQGEMSQSGRSSRAYIVGASIRSNDQTLYPENETVSESLRNRFNAVPSADSPERRILLVDLYKEADVGIGITIVGGDTVSKLDLGIFVQSVIPGGPADQDGRIKTGDRIIAVNGTSLEGKPHHEAVDILRQSADPVQLLLSQPAFSRSTPDVTTVSPRQEGQIRMTPRRNLEDRSRSLPNFDAELDELSPTSLNDDDKDLKLDPDMNLYHLTEVNLTPSTLAPSPDRTLPTSPPVSQPLHLRTPPVMPLELDISSDESENLEIEDILPRELMTDKQKMLLDQQVSLSSAQAQEQLSVSSDTAPEMMTSTEVKHNDRDIPQREPPPGSTNHYSSNHHAKDTRTSNVQSIDVPSIEPLTHIPIVQAPEQTQTPNRTPVTSPVPRNETEVEGQLNAHQRLGPKLTPMSEAMAGMAAVSMATESTRAERLTPMDTAMKAAEDETFNAMAAKYEENEYSDEELDDLEVKGYDLSTAGPKASIVPGQVYHVTLEKTQGSLGLNVTGGVNTTVKDGGIYVKSLAPGGAAEQHGVVHVGDRVFEVNGVSLVGVTHKQAVETLRSTPQVSKLVMQRGTTPGGKIEKTPTATPTSMKSDATSGGEERPRSAATPMSVKSDATSGVEERSLSALSEVIADDDFKGDYPFVTRGNVQEVSLTKGSSGLGISVIGGRGSSAEPLLCIPRIRTIFPFGPAAASGKVKVGDVILEVNGRKVKDMTHQEVVMMLRTLPAHVKLLLCQPDPSLLEPIPEAKDESRLISPQRSHIDSTSYSESDSSTSTPRSPTVQSATATQNTQPIKNQTISPNDNASGHSDLQSPFENIQSPVDDILSSAASSLSESLHSELTSPDVATSPEADWQQQRSRTPSTVCASSVSSLDSDGSVVVSPAPLVDKQLSQIVNEGRPATGDGTSTSTDVQDTRIADLHKNSESSDYPLPDSDFPSSLDREVESISLSASETSTATSAENTIKPVPGEQFSLSLTRHENGTLGFAVAGGLHTTGYLYIKDIVSQDLKKTLCPGDRIVEVDGQGMHKLPHVQAVTILRQAPQKVTITFYRPRPQSLSSPGPSPNNVTPLTPEGASIAMLRTSPHGKQEQVQNTEQTPAQSPSSGIQITVEKIEAESATPDPSEQATSVKQRIQALESDKTIIKPHDYTSPTRDKANANSTVLLSPDEAPHNTQPTGGAGDTVATLWGSMSLPLSDDEKQLHMASRQETDSLLESGAIRIELERDEREGFGFSLVQGDRGSIFIRTITPGGAADKEGRLREGDRLLQVNGETLIGMTHSKAIALLRKAHGTVSLAVARPSSRPSSVASAYAPGDQASPEQDRQTDRLTDEDSQALQSLIESVKGSRHSTNQDGSPTRSCDQEDQSYDTDSDVDSTMLDMLEETRDPDTLNKLTKRLSDRDAIDSAHLPKLPKPATTTNNNVGSDSDTDQWSEDEENGGGYVPSQPPTVPIQSSDPNVSIPTRITDDWLNTLTIVRPADDSMQYKGRQLQSFVRQLKVSLESDQPTEEYKVLRHAKLTDLCNVARSAENRTKNRFRNVLPYDANRVILSGDDDYINASHIKINTGKQSYQYIACQGPLPNTSNAFWRMVWEQGVHVISMLTLDMENMKVKCHQYWPNTVDMPITIDNRYEVSLTHTEKLEHFLIRHITMEDLETGEPRRILQLNFTRWPDHGTPAAALPLLQYIRLQRLIHQSGPVVVHCSAGIGRTGAVITIDVALGMIERDVKIEFEKIVNDLRRQRQGMIQTKDQYIFCYKAILEVLQSLDADTETEA